MKIHAVASLPHYREHVMAVWKHLPDGLKGGVHDVGLPKETPEDDLVMVAGFYDVDRARGRRIIYVEHGAGQAYRTDKGSHPAYHGSDHPENVIGYIAPRQEVADSWDRPAVAVGSPVCDDYPLGTDNEEPVAVITSHWNCRIVPETLSAMPHYIDDLGRVVHALRRQGFTVRGHSHPRDPRLPVTWRALQIPRIGIEEVRRTCDLLIVDNSSLAFEMLHLGRSVVTLNAPWYRRDVEHGLRFWEHAPGLQVDEPEQLVELDFAGEALHSDASPARAAYGRAFSDGQAGIRAAAWVTQLVHGL